MKHFFVDTNVVIDVLADRKPFSAASAKLFLYTEKGHANLYICSLSYSNIYYVLRKNSTHEKMMVILRDLESLTVTLDTTRQVIINALNADFHDFKDAIQYHTALANKKVQAIVTRNGKDYKNSQLPVLAPEEAVSLLESAGL